VGDPVSAAGTNPSGGGVARGGPASATSTAAARDRTSSFTPCPDRAWHTTELVTEAGAHAQALSRKGSE
jgi:hypothetical protein